MTVAYVTKGSPGTPSGTQITISPPANTAGQLMLLQLAITRGTSVSSISEVGWELAADFASGTSADSNIRTVVYYKFATGSTSSFTVNLSAPYESQSVITTWSGVSRGNPVTPITTAVSSTTNATVTLSGLTPTISNGRLVAVVGVGSNGTATTLTNNQAMTEHHDASGNWAHTALYSEGPLTTAATGNRTFTISAAREWAGTLFVLNDDDTDPSLGSTVTTTTNAYATAYSNQRQIDRTSNGVLWHLPAAWGSSTYATEAFYSTDGGLTWNNAGASSSVSNFSGSTASNYTRNHSFFIDQDDYAHVVFKDNQNGWIFYRRGTPNASRTAWTWSNTTTIWNTDSTGNYPDIVAHREGTGWSAHVILSRPNDNGSDVQHIRLTITSAHAVSVSATTVIAGSGYGAMVHKWGSIDFNHTGDGKTVASGTPHLYTAWSAGATGVGKGIRFRKATYSGGTWTWNTEVEIKNDYYVSSEGFRVNCLFDGTRAMITGFLRDSGGNNCWLVAERNAADTTTTIHNAITLPAASWLSAGTTAFDRAGNLYMFGRDDVNNMVYRKWTRTALDFGPKVTIGPATSDGGWATSIRGEQGDRIPYVYLYNGSIKFNTIVTNFAPTITVTTPTENQKLDPRVVNNVAWTYSDVEGSPQASWTADVRTPAPAPSSYAGGAAAQTGNIQTFTVPMTGTYTIEAIGAAGGQSSEGNAGGKGAKIVGKFNLTAGQELRVIAGKPGTKPSSATRGGSGGGASWVYIQGQAQPMIVAGGGGGAGNYTYDATTQDASTGTSGKAGQVGLAGSGSGGSSGNGGSAGTYGSGGAGWLTNGANGSSTTGGATPANGAGGGNGYNVAVDGGNGGFGGGGGSYAGAGGGAGYSGGGGGGWSNAGHGGGGGSYNAGTNQVNTAGVGTDSGSVTISMDSTVVFSTSGTTATNFNIPANSMADETNYEINLSVSDGLSSTAVKRNVLSDSWTYPAEVVTSTQSGNLDASTFEHGANYQIQVATSDAVGYGPYSSSVTYVNDNLPETEIVPPSIFGVTQGTVQYTYSDKDGDAPTKFQVRYRKKI